VSESIFTKGRGATLNARSTRFDDAQRIVDGNWRDEAEALDGVAPPPSTTTTIERPKTIISRNVSPDVPFDRSINAYRGCEHGCIYCFARPTHAFHNLSPGLDFETRLFAKPDAPRLLRAELSKRGYTPATIAMGTNTDPYQPIEDTHRVTRGLLEVLLEFGHPVSIVTKSDRVTRDIDLLGELAARGLVSVGVSVTTLDPVLARKLEPRAPAPKRRLAAVTRLLDAGVPVAVLIAPVIPAITDHEIETLVEAAAQAGALAAYCIPVRLPNEVAPLFRDWLATHFPKRAAHVMSLIRGMRGGRDNDSDFGSRMRGEGPFAELIRTRFNAARRRFGLEGRLPDLRTDLFRRPGPEQLAFL